MMIVSGLSPPSIKNPTEATSSNSVRLRHRGRHGEDRAGDVADAKLTDLLVNLGQNRPERRRRRSGQSGNGHRLAASTTDTVADGCTSSLTPSRCGGTA